VDSGVPTVEGIASKREPSGTGARGVQDAQVRADGFARTRYPDGHTSQVRIV